MQDLDKNIYIIKTPEGNEVSFCATRGGIVTSVKIKGKEILYLDTGTFRNKKANVRGGIPILFPNAGALASADFPLLKQHGFARSVSGWTSEITTSGFIEKLLSDEESMNMYPYSFELRVTGGWKGDVFTLTQAVTNTEVDKSMPVSMGLHPYFRVKNSEKANARFDFEGGKFIEENISKWGNGEYVCIDNPKIKDENSIMKITIPGIGVLCLDASIQYQKVWIWSLPGSDFICIEPVMRDVGGLVASPEMVLPGATLSASLRMWIL